MPRIQTTTPPFPSTILSLNADEQFQISRTTRAEAITVAPADAISPAHFTLSGTTTPTTPGRPERPYISEPYRLGDIPTALPPSLQAITQQVLTRYITEGAASQQARRQALRALRALPSEPDPLLTEAALSRATGPAASHTARRMHNR